jgi:hypothetical protein
MPTQYPSRLAILIDQGRACFHELLTSALGEMQITLEEVDRIALPLLPTGDWDTSNVIKGIQLYLEIHEVCRVIIACPEIDDEVEALKNELCREFGGKLTIMIMPFGPLTGAESESLFEPELLIACGDGAHYEWLRERLQENDLSFDDVDLVLFPQGIFPDPMMILGATIWNDFFREYERVFLAVAPGCFAGSSSIAVQIVGLLQDYLQQCAEPKLWLPGAVGEHNRRG